MAKFTNGKQYRKEITHKFNDHIVLFLGPEEGDKEKSIIQICSLIFKDDNEQKNSVSRFRIESDELLKAVDFALAPSIFFNQKVCIIHNIDLISSTPNNILLFTDMMRNTPPSTKIIMTSQQNTLPAFIKQDLFPLIRTIQFWKYFDSDMFNYITMTLKSKGYIIDRETVQYLLEQTGNDIKKVDDAIDTIDNYADTKNVTIQLIKTLVPAVKDITIFDFLDSLFKRDKNALKNLNTLLNYGTPDLLILNMILKQLETIEKYILLTTNGTTSDDALKQCGIYSKKIESFWQYINNFSTSAIKHLLQAIAKTDLQLKSNWISKSFIANPLADLVQNILFFSDSAQ